MTRPGQGTGSAFFVVSALYFFAGAHFYTPNLGHDGLYRLYNEWGWIYASLIIGVGMWRIYRRGTLVTSRLLAWIWLGALLMLVPLLYPFPLKQWAVPHLLGLFGGLLFLVALYQFEPTREDFTKLLYLVLGAVLIESAIAFMQFYIYTDGNWLGYDKRVNQPYGVFLQRNVLASFLATGVAIALWLLIHESTLTWLRRALTYGVLAVACMVLVLGQSRAGMVGGLLAAGLMLPVLARQRRDRLPFAVACIAAGLVAGLLSLGSGDTRLAESLGLRGAMWRQSLQLFAASPWVGHGYGGFEVAYINGYRAAQAKDPALPPIEENLDHPHNELLYWGVEGGIVPLIGIGLAVAGFFLRLRGLGYARALPLLGLVAPLVLHTQTEFPFYMSMLHWLVFLLLVALADHEAGPLQSRPFPSRLLPVFAIGIPLVVIPFMLTALHSNFLLMRYVSTGFTDTSLLLGIKNRVAVLGEFEYAVYTARLSREQPADLQAYVDWGRKANAHRPRAVVYMNMYLALRKLGKTQEAEELRKDAHRLYPNHRFFRGSGAVEG